MQAAIKLLNEFPVLRWLGIVLAIMASVAAATWKISDSLNEIQSSIMLIQRDLKGFQTDLDELRAEVRKNTEYRLRQEGPVK